MEIKKERCKALCKDGTKCLNKAKYNGYCKKHDKFEINVRR